MNPTSITRLTVASDERPDDVWNWYNLQARLLGSECRRALAELEEPSNNSEYTPSPYLGMTGGELQVFFASQQRELDFVTMLGLFSAAEGRLQLDFHDRIQKRAKDRVSREFRNIARHKRRRGEWINLELDILDVWLAHAGSAERRRAINNFRSAMRLRHWLAHGRHWILRLGRDYDAARVYGICTDLLRAIGA